MLVLKFLTEKSFVPKPIVKVKKIKFSFIIGSEVCLHVAGGGRGGAGDPQKFDKMTIMLLEVSSLPLRNRRKYISTAPQLEKD